MGNAFTSWAVYVDGVKYSSFENSTIGYIPGATQGSRITVMAIWNENEYTIDYILNGGTWGKIEGISTYYVSEVDKMSLPDPHHTEYPNYINFLGWYRDEACAELFDKSTLKVNPDNITLYAKWEEYECHYISEVKSKGSITVLNDIAIIDCTGVTSSEYIVNGTIFTSDTTRVYFIGNSGTTLKEFKIGLCSFNPNKTNVYVRFDNIKMTGMFFQKNGSLDLNTTLECANTNSIIALNGEQAILDLTTLTIKGDSLYVKGGDGTDATTSGGNGTAGATAIVVDKLIIDMTGELTIVGGNGGMGSSGISYDPWNGVSSARAGGNGGNGGVGGDAFVGSEVIIYAGKSITFMGGNGGEGKNGGSGEGSNGSGVSIGGIGGSGGNGGAGGSALTANNIFNYSGDNIVTLCSGSGGKGGSGGQGGHGLDKNTRDSGGDGGDGGNSGYCINGTVVTNSTIITLISGAAGDGGNGGNGGNAYRDSVHGNKVYIGNGGNGGNGGNCLISSIKLDANYYYLTSTATSGKGGAGGVSGGGASGVGAIHYGTGGTGGNSGSIVIGDNTTTGKSGSTGTKAVNGAGGTGGSAVSVIAI